MKATTPTILAVIALTCAASGQNEFGPDAGNSANIGAYNTAYGYQALFSNTGSFNTAYGAGALYANTNGGNNTASGVSALSFNTAGSFNTANGAYALLFNTTGSYNTADGFSSLGQNQTGMNNTAVGVSALYLNQTGSNNIAVGYAAGNYVEGDNNIDIGNYGETADYNTIRIGYPFTHTRAFIAGINGALLPGNPTNAVVIDANSGQLAAVPLGSLVGPAGATGPQGPVGFQGPPGNNGVNGVGFVPGAYLYLPFTAPAPAGFNKIGTKTDLITDLHGRIKVLKMNVYQKN
jgi:hypothetical protein